MPNASRDTSGAAAAGPVRRPSVEVAFDKVVRDSFTMPSADYQLIGVLKQRCIDLGIAMKKSELLRAGLAALQRLPDEGLVQVVTAVENVKTGRPPGKKKRKKKKRKAKRRKLLDKSLGS